MYKPTDCAEWKEINDFIQVVPSENLKELEDHLRKSFKGMMKAGAAKTADIMIPRD